MEVDERLISMYNVCMQPWNYTAASTAIAVDALGHCRDAL